MLKLQPMFMGNADEGRIGILVKGNEVLQAKFINHEDLEKGQKELYDDFQALEEGDLVGKQVLFFSAQDYWNLRKENPRLKAKIKKLQDEFKLQAEAARKWEALASQLSDKRDEVMAELAATNASMPSFTDKEYWDLLAEVKAKKEAIKVLMEAVQESGKEKAIERQNRLKAIERQNRLKEQAYQDAADYKDQLNEARNLVKFWKSSHDSAQKELNETQTQIKNLRISWDQKISKINQMEKDLIKAEEQAEKYRADATAHECQAADYFGLYEEEKKKGGNLEKKLDWAEINKSFANDQLQQKERDLEAANASFRYWKDVADQQEKELKAVPVFKERIKGYLAQINQLHIDKQKTEANTCKLLKTIERLEMERGTDISRIRELEKKIEKESTLLKFDPNTTIGARIAEAAEKIKSGKAIW